MQAPPQGQGLSDSPPQLLHLQSHLGNERVKTGKLVGQRSQVSQDTSDEINENSHITAKNYHGCSFRAYPFFPGQVAADCDNDQMGALLCNITNTLLAGDGSTDISQLPGHMNYSGAFMITSFLNFSTLLTYFFGEAPQTFLNWGRVERSQTFSHRDFK